MIFWSWFGKPSAKITLKSLSSPRNLLECHPAQPVHTSEESDQSSMERDYFFMTFSKSKFQTLSPHQNIDCHRRSQCQAAHTPLGGVQVRSSKLPPKWPFLLNANHWMLLDGSVILGNLDTETQTKSNQCLMCQDAKAKGLSFFQSWLFSARHMETQPAVGCDWLN